MWSRRGMLFFSDSMYELDLGQLLECCLNPKLPLSVGGEGVCGPGGGCYSFPIQCMSWTLDNYWSVV
jgi:hypothetical protein